MADFRNAREAGDLINVVVQDGSEGADTGLVIVPLKGSTMSIYMEPLSVGEARWRVTLEPSEDTTVLSSFELQGLAAELSVAAELCAYLEARSAGHDEQV
ncbi:hypothetical protein [Microbacterium sp. SLBN-146]|uniref:hypothetical protein n=1 Tax=Microbacterium sp. SLBN-146 TaxID=2768457 RepID=UPI0021B190F4|nr:hypothetical protein [Microbacterium sp. SLBN-146]